MKLAALMMTAALLALPVMAQSPRRDAAAQDRPPRPAGLPRALQGAGRDQHHPVGRQLHRRRRGHGRAAEGRRLSPTPTSDRGRADGHPKEGSLVAVLHGTDPKAKPILLLAHIDVVEANRADWTRDPFKLVEENGYFFGRGTSDDKAQAAIWADSLVRLKQEGFKPKRDIKMALTCGEESEAYNGIEDLVKNHRALSTPNSPSTKAPTACWTSTTSPSCWRSRPARRSIRTSP
jgi:acetylornithine deacetylase/succinyl-diaminopimelate desuccinylase-like protein